MTKLEHAFLEAAKLSPSEQDALADLILQELASESRWSEAFGRSQDKLEQLADEALNEHRAGKTHPLDPDHL
jgi:hypothetical protein